MKHSSSALDLKRLPFEQLDMKSTFPILPPTSKVHESIHSNQVPDTPFFKLP